MKDQQLRFYGGPWVSFTPILIFVVIAIYVATTVAGGSIQGMWVGAIIGLLVSFLLAKDKAIFGKTVLKGMGSETAIAPVACWIFAGIFATVLRDSGLVNGILWAAYHTGTSGTMFIVITFFASALFATAAGTGFGTITAGMGMLYPAGVLLGADPAILAGAIIGGGAFGDNLAPISDTTISAATSQNTDIGGVVKHRIRYVIPAAAMTIITMVALSAFQSTSAGAVPLEKIQDVMDPRGLWMLLPAAATIYTAIKKGDIVFATIIGILLGSVVSILTGLNTLGNIIAVDGGLLLRGVSGWMADLCILVILLSAGIQMMLDGGGSQRLLEAFGNVKNARAYEIISGFLALVMSSLMSINAPAILAVGLSFAKPMGEKFGVSPYRRANVIGNLACTLVYSLPWSAALLLAASLSQQASESFAGVPALSPLELTPMVLYAWFMLATMIFAIFTGWGRGELEAPELKVNEAV
ncbi:sodium:proton antiporter [Photobacterium proteolyticum]|uniref:Sodium:proton antiporter n=1 Tax=Photobacterium proteolyticum TaxID=1903952 RepID=A0A1Q9GEC2_9GAMM|nr:Na+/H+ antiporter NhaC family protein [Photobacterium proteolyticum]OLQ72743.1 sodium:proton antiporter [Photobacterium proteolyticum]